MIRVGGTAVRIADFYGSTWPATRSGRELLVRAPYGEARQAAPTVGIFVDAGGTDTYAVGGAPRMLNNAAWSYEPQPYPMPQVVTTERGCGADSASGTASLP